MAKWINDGKHSAELDLENGTVSVNEDGFGFDLHFDSYGVPGSEDRTKTRVENKKAALRAVLAALDEQKLEVQAVLDRITTATATTAPAVPATTPETTPTNPA